ncbi:MAG: DUF3108 domain-containing protein [Fidelibacterota bacterium]
MLRTALWVILALVPLLAQETDHYTVYFWKIPSAHLAMTVSPGQDGDLKELTFTARTTDAFSYFFSVDNTYKTVFDPVTFQLVQYEKKVKQPNIEQTVNIVWNRDERSFQSGGMKYRRPEGTLNIFSLLMMGRSLEWKSLDATWREVDHEGRPFRSRYLWIDSARVQIGDEKYLADHYRLDLIPGDRETADVVEVTDVFTWGIALENCVRQIWIERGPKRRILRAQAKVRGFTVLAELKDE